MTTKKQAQRLAAAHVRASKVRVTVNGIEVKSLKAIHFDNSVKAKSLADRSGFVVFGKTRAEPSGEIEPASAARYPGQLTVSEFLTRPRGLARVAPNFQTKLSAAISCGVPMELWPPPEHADELVHNPASGWWNRE